MLSLKLTIYVPYDIAIPLLGRTHNNVFVPRDTKKMFKKVPNSTLLMTVPTWKPPTVEERNKLTEYHIIQNENEQTTTLHDIMGNLSNKMLS